MSEPILSAPLLGNRLLELTPEGRGYRLSVTQLDGRDRRMIGGFDLKASEFPIFLALARAMASYVRTAA
jgi:hypothetical protein